jgi:hypothetical protein
MQIGSTPTEILLDNHNNDYNINQLLSIGTVTTNQLLVQFNMTNMIPSQNTTIADVAVNDYVTRRQKPRRRRRQRRRERKQQRYERLQERRQQRFKLIRQHFNSFKQRIIQSHKNNFLNTCQLEHMYTLEWYQIREVSD